ncbi:MAG: hypothetical protein AABY36_07765, partial [Campylobacterota bacterium]
MIKLFTIFCFTSILFASDTVGVGVQKKEQEKSEEQKKVVYAVQLFAEQNIDSAKITQSEMSKKIKDKITLHKIGNYIVGRYSQSESYSETKVNLQKIYEAGYKDSYIITSTDVDMKNNLVLGESKEEEKQAPQAPKAQTKEQDNQTPKTPKIEKNSNPKISKSEKSNILLKAQNAYEKGDENEAMIYYEMLLASGEKSQKIKNNLCYMYGKRGAWLQAKEIIDAEQFNGKLVYAYAYGAVLGNQDNYYSDLSEYIMVDKSGRLMLLSGYYFEKREDMQRAASFYKMAYEKNPSDFYNIFAYARILDMQQNKEALAFYKKILSKIDAS